MFSSESWFIFVLLAIFVIVLWGVAARRAKIASLSSTLRNLAMHDFLVQPCTRCHESAMKLLDVSPNGRSLQYECLHCKKKMRAPASSPNAATAVTAYAELQQLCPAPQKGPLARKGVGFDSEKVLVLFDTIAAPLPYEQTTRDVIAEATRSEVWRRDEGKCVECGSNQQLEFDHIIPVSRGGATTSRNLQLLCRACNSRKSASI
jgi:hypothetical protein